MKNKKKPTKNGEIVVIIDKAEHKIRVDSNDTAETISAKIQKIYDEARKKYLREIGDCKVVLDTKVF